MSGPSLPNRPPPGGGGGRVRGHEALGRPTGVQVTPDELRVTRRPVVPAGEGGGRSGRGLGRAWRRVAQGLRALLEHDRVVLVGLVVLAAALRFIGLETRGRFDGDQGHDVLVLLRLVRDGTLPLLGPPTSIGDFHHGAAYYYLLAPVAWLSDANPVAIVAWIAALGVAAVGATWWFARAVGGRVVAAIAALLMVVSPASIEESTFIWNPNPIPLFAALSLGSAWRAHAGGSTRWWAVALATAGMVVQLHVLGIVFVAPILALAVSDAIGAVRSGDDARGRAIGGSVAVGIGLAAILFIPLLVSELRTGFEESRHVLEFLAGGGGGEGQPGRDPVNQVLITLFRVVGWPLVGLVTDAPVGAVVAVSSVLVLSAWLVIATRDAERTAARWLGLTVLWSSLALTILAPSLQTVVAGLPNDHYHAYIDPVVFVLVGLGARAIASGSGPHQRVDVAARAIVAVALVALIGLDLRLTPPPDPNGGWPFARDAGERIVTTADGPYDVRQLPIFKTAEGVGFPMIVAGGDVVAIATDVASSRRTLQPGSTLVLACDRIFEGVLHARCGGPAEATYLRQLTGDEAIPTSIDQFDLSPRIVITLYRL